MKKYFINKYYGFIFWLEDVFGGIEDMINKHRERFDEKYRKYL